MPASFAMWPHMSAMELDIYSITVSQPFFMLNLAKYYFIKKQTSPMKLQIDNDDIGPLKIFNTHQTADECQMRF